MREHTDAAKTILKELDSRSLPWEAKDATAGRLQAIALREFIKAQGKMGEHTSEDEASSPAGTEAAPPADDSPAALHHQKIERQALPPGHLQKLNRNLKSVK